MRNVTLFISIIMGVALLGLLVRNSDGASKLVGSTLGSIAHLVSDFSSGNNYQ